LLQELVTNHVDVIKTETLYFFDNERGLTLGQGE